MRHTCKTEHRTSTQCSSTCSLLGLQSSTSLAGLTPASPFINGAPTSTASLRFCHLATRQADIKGETAAGSQRSLCEAVLFVSACSPRGLRVRKRRGPPLSFSVTSASPHTSLKCTRARAHAAHSSAEQLMFVISVVDWSPQALRWSWGRAFSLHCYCRMQSTHTQKLTHSSRQYP